MGKSGELLAPLKEAVSPAIEAGNLGQTSLLSAVQLEALKSLGLDPAQLKAYRAVGSKAKPFEGPAPESLKGKPLSEICQALLDFEKKAADSRYETAASRVRFLIWKRQYTAN